MSLLEKAETFVLATVRIVLVAVGSIGILAMAGLLFWTGWAALAPSDADHSEFLTAPTYAEVRIDLLPTPTSHPSTGGSEENSSPGKDPQSEISPFADRLFIVTSTIDKQYNIAGRKEKKFSETVSASYLENVLIEQGLALQFLELEAVIDDYLLALQSFASEIAEDQVLSRISDTASRTSIIIDAINKFHAEYVLRLQDSFDSASNLSAKRSTSKNLTLQVLFWSLCSSFAIFLISSLVLVVFRIERHLRETVETPEIGSK